MTVVSGGSVNLGSAVIDFYNPDDRQQIVYEKGVSGTYYAGTYTLAYQDMSIGHQDGQTAYTAFRGKIDASYSAVDWEFEEYFTLPAMDSATSITSFNGQKLKGDLQVVFTPKTGYTYKLKISLNGDNSVADTFNSYVSGSNVRLSSETIAYIQNKTKSKTVTLKATLLSYKSGVLIGQRDATLNVSNTKGLHLRINGVWKEAIPYVRVNGQWKEATPYIRNNQWKEGI